MSRLKSSKLLGYGAACVLASLASGCSSFMPEDPTVFRRDGLVSLSRPVPSALTMKNESSPLGFMESSLPPLSTAKVNSVVVAVDREDGVLSLVNAHGVIKTFSVEGSGLLKSGSFSVIHKQRDPLWFASNSYFENRGQPVPDAASRERYRRGALGDMALFIDENTAIHSGPIRSDEVGGIRVSRSDLEQIYPLLEVGTVIEIR